jgi:hypothetical protein
MSKRYLVTNIVHFIGGRLVYPDQGEASIVTLEKGIEPGKYLVEVGASAPAAAPQEVVLTYSAKHIGRGDYVVERIADEARVSKVFSNTGVQGEAKEQAEAEADRLNKGGELSLEPTPDPVPGGDADLPDA